MRKALIATVVAAGLFAVGAFAANFTVTADDVASGANTVGRCASDAAVSWETTGVAQGATATAGDYYVTTATVVFTPESETKSCDGAEVKLSVRIGTNWVPATSCGPVSDEETTCTFGATDAPVSTLNGVAVLADGSSIPAEQPAA